MTSRSFQPTPFLPLLADILESTRAAIAQRKRGGQVARHILKELQSRIRDQEPTRSLQKAIARPKGHPPRLIAEIKRASPSKGIFRESFAPVEIAKIYQGEGADALSILTEERFFLGQLSFLSQVRGALSSPLPILQKDFILDEIQIYEARAFGADALLLIPALLEKQQALDYFYLAADLALSVLVEVHTEEELEAVLDWAHLIGINNRDLSTFVIDLQTTPRLMKKIPDAARASVSMVSESGIASREDVQFLAEAGIDALLIGEAFMKAESIEKKMKELFGKKEERAG